MNPYIIAFIAIICYASLGVIAKKVQIDIPPFTFITITMIGLMGLSAIVAFIYERNFSISTITPMTWLWLIAFATVNFVGFILYLNAIGKMPIVEYQIIAVITPIIGGILGYLILAEALTMRYFIGIIFMAVGLYISLKK